MGERDVSLKIYKVKCTEFYGFFVDHFKALMMVVTNNAAISPVASTNKRLKRKRRGM